MNILRWIALLPIIYVLTNIVYLATGLAAVSFSWWRVAIIFGIAIIPISIAGAMSVFVAPYRKVGRWIFVGVLLISETFKVREMIDDWPGYLIFWRVIANLVMINGALRMPEDPKAQEASA